MKFKNKVELFIVIYDPVPGEGITSNGVVKEFLIIWGVNKIDIVLFILLKTGDVLSVALTSLRFDVFNFDVLILKDVIKGLKCLII